MPSTAAHAFEHGAARSVHRAAPQRSLDLDLHEHAREVAATAQLRVQLAERRFKRKVAGLAGVEQVDGETGLGLPETELLHHLSRSVDLLFGHATVRLGEMAHGLERRAEEGFLHGAGGRNRRHGRLALAFDLQVHLVARETAKQRARRSTDEEAEQAAQDLALQCHPPRSPVVAAPNPHQVRGMPPS